jgi:hypothetical protein
MSECTNSEMQDRLPEFAAERLPAGERMAVELHVAGCAACRSDVEVLRAVQDARPLTPTIDVARIVAALPAPPRPVARPADRGPVPTLRVIPGGLADAPSVTAPTVRATPVRPAARTALRWFTGAGMRAAAALTLVALGGLSVAIARRGQMAITEGAVVLADGPMLLAFEELPYAPDVEPIAPVVPVAPAVLPIQELSDYTDDELAELLDQLDAWDGAPTLEVLDPVLTTTPDTSREGSDA